jgi:hypothetical protein
MGCWGFFVAGAVSSSLPSLNLEKGSANTKTGILDSASPTSSSTLTSSPQAPPPSPSSPSLSSNNPSPPTPSSPLAPPPSSPSPSPSPLFSPSQTLQEPLREESQHPCPFSATKFGVIERFFLIGRGCLLMWGE